MAAAQHEALRKQIRYVEGQAGGVLRMIERAESGADVIVQIRAMRAGIERALALAVERVARERLAGELEARVRDCPGLCDYCDDVLAIIEELDLHDVIKAASA